jgi:hypothetical protein
VIVDSVGEETFETSIEYRYTQTKRREPKEVSKVGQWIMDSDKDSTEGYKKHIDL